MRLYRELQLDDDLAPLALEGLALETLAGLSRRLRERRRTPPQWLARERPIHRVKVTIAYSTIRTNFATGLPPGPMWTSNRCITWPWFFGFDCPPENFHVLSAMIVAPRASR